MTPKHFALLFWAGAIGAPAQNTFFISLDSVQLTNNGGSGVGQSVEEVSDGYLVFCYQNTEDSLPSSFAHMFIRKLDHQGVVQWSKEINHGVQEDQAYGYFAIDPVCRGDSGEFVCGIYSLSRIALYWFNENGDTLRTRTIAGPVTDSTGGYSRQTVRCADGGYAVAGTRSILGITKAAIYRTTAMGDSLWVRTYPNTHMPHGIAAHPDGGLVLIGDNAAPGNYDRYFLLRTDSLGGQLWQRDFGGYMESHTQVRVLGDGTIVTWATYSDMPHWQAPYVMRLTRWSPQGDTLWSSDIMVPYETRVGDFEVLSDGSFICSSAWANTFRFNKFSAQGDSLWDRYHSFVLERHWPYDVEPTSDGGFICSGYTSLNGLQAILVLKMDSLGCLVPGCHLVGVSEYAIELQEHLKLWPNPATDHVRLELELPKGAAVQGAVQAVLLDATGREVLRERVRQNGNTLSHAFTLTPFPPGLYHLHLADEKRWLAGGRVVVSLP